MINIAFYTFSKKPTSTKQPTGSGNVLTCNIKSRSSIINPVIEVKTNITAYNYCYISSFGRYYYITDITFDSGLWIAQCRIDVLATYKTEIGSTSMFVLRSANASNGEIIDTLNPTTAYTTISAVNPTALTSSMLHDSIHDVEDGYYVLGVQGYDQASDNGVIYYQLTPDKFTLLLHTFYANSGNGTWWGNLSRGVIDSLAHISDYIVSCRWFPKSFVVDYGIDDSGPQPVQGDGYEIYLGSLNTHIKAPRVIGNIGYLVCYDDIPKHPQASYGNYTKVYPFTHYQLCDPLLGVITLNPVIMKNDTSVTQYMNFDYITGDVEITLTGNNTHYPFYTTYIKGSVDINLSGTSVDVGGFITNRAGVIANLRAENPIGAIAGIRTTINDIQPQPGNNQSNGIMLPLIGYAPFIRCCFKQITNRDVTNRGLPLYDYRQPSALGGYILPDNPEVAIDGTGNEIDMLKSLLAGGFFYE